MTPFRPIPYPQGLHEPAPATMSHDASARTARLMTKKRHHCPPQEPSSLFCALGACLRRVFELACDAVCDKKLVLTAVRRFGKNVTGIEAPYVLFNKRVRSYTDEEWGGGTERRWVFIPAAQPTQPSHTSLL